MLGVFVGLFGGQRVGHFFWGGHFGEIGPFLAHFRPKGSNRERERESIFYFWALRQPAWPLGTPQEGGWWGGTNGVLLDVACRAPPPRDVH